MSSSLQPRPSLRASRRWLDEPDYTIGFTAAVRRGFSKAFVYDGRASKAEYWNYVLFSALAALAVLLVSGPVIEVGLPETFGVFLWLAGVITLTVPQISLAVRRLHDTGRSGAFYLLNFVPFGSI